MNITNIDHIGIAVINLEKSIKFYEEVLGLKCCKIEEVKDQKARTAFFQIGESKIELLESTDEDGPIGKFIAKRGEGIHHIALKSRNLEESLAELKSKSVKLIDESPRKGADGMDIAFIHPKSANGVLIEMCN
ncbi:4-hydroxyphenylpyruvate dioxygenase [bacterium BMS3Abin03]|nr:4-hydroxyphenylpyruvate dioxygenase [bacterium BMS3Abin03]